MEIRAEALDQLAGLFDRYEELRKCSRDIERALELMVEAFSRDNAVLIAGNGGSAADAAHIVGELMKRFVLPRPISADIRSRISASSAPEALRSRMLSKLEMPLRAVNLSHEDSLSTAFANDADPELVIAQKLLGFGRSDDVFLGISTSGNSRNIVSGAYLARSLGIHVIALTGRAGGALKNTADVTIAVPADSTAEVQEYHLPVYHALCAAAEAHFFPLDHGSSQHKSNPTK